MALKILNSLNSADKPVIVSSSIKEKHLQANQIAFKDFNGEISSVTGIVSKGLYIAKINQLTTDCTFPSVNLQSSEYFHIDKSKVRYSKGAYGSTWNKTKNVICNEDEQN